MFVDVNRTIEALLKADLPREVANQVSIAFVTPDDSFPPTSLSLPAINLFLFDVRENSELRSVVPELVRKSDGSTLAVPPPVQLDCHYLVTAIASNQVGAEQDELRILGAALKVFLRHRVLPPPLLQGELQGKTPPVRASAARKGPPSLDQWQALKGKPRASFQYVLTVPFDVSPPEAGGVHVKTLSVGQR